MNEAKPGSMIRVPLWPEPVEVKLIEETEGYIHIVGATTISRDHSEVA
jgi:hypothetical protein